ncbi:sugar ABC transporter substrate-binding protein [Verminephrobacter aporrectodeae]|uniref:Sugar ABC transporter substrate-binding protein n=2 Tax=Verminephrobacter TaxID=364316 RepID=A0ABT3KYJ6_9BURK|nr:sugar ABC transporter substrate-binding protein [Verminephrobacter aporrectodeae]MCW5223604.1 sugar ABC transporter substrate-binding protein [Verminephrobacter aporrectodeae subsp. tuberculatae]MCW5256234.1 sugar ABC transporter substrate-binding protein [Verminephrobacter aporrectodeae subsp. tuberculatae]MCW5289069.1 sugar ABC transporter substrate-binding protein [Verminephrobacter aporrectodeae subsp. tuberculatae]MCW5323406.1 sugar ABC transporter substrate-binding protein [Verminephro
MKFTRKMAVTALAATALVALASGAAHAQNIAVVTHGQANDAFWSVVKNGVEAAAKDAGIKVSYRAPESFDMVAMSRLIDAAVNQKPDGLVVSLPDASALGPAIQRAVKAGIPVITINSGQEFSKKLGALLHVGQSEYEAGRVAGEKLKAMGGKNGICVNQEVGNVSLDQRCKGFADGFAGKSKVLPTGNDPAEARAKVKAALDSDTTLDTIMLLGAATVGEPALAAAKDSGRMAKIHLATFDLSAGFLKAIAAKEAAFAIDQQQFLQGYLPVSFLALHAKYGLIPAGNVPSGPNLVTAEKAAQVIELSAKGIR